jgi:hypothetical protein
MRRKITSMIRDQVEIAIGDRFKMSPLGADRCPRLADKEGVIVGGGQYPCTVRVIFDGSKSPTALHRDYIITAAKKAIDRALEPKKVRLQPR